MKNPPKGEAQALVELVTYRVPAGVDDAAKVMAEFLAKVAMGKESCALISKTKATELLGSMLGSYNIKQLEALAAKGNLIAYVGDVVGTGSLRKSATNSVLWFTGEDIPFVPNKRFGGFCLGFKIAPIFFNTMEDAGALPIELNVEQMNMGDEIELRVDQATARVTR